MNFTFVEGPDNCGKTTMVRELQRRSRYHINGICDRGPLSRIVWGQTSGDPRDTWAPWRDWLVAAQRLVCIILVVDDLDVLWARVVSEMSLRGYAGYPWTKSTFCEHAGLYLREVQYLTQQGVTVHYVDLMAYRIRYGSDNPVVYDVAYDNVAKLLGFRGQLDKTSSAYAVGDRDL